MATFAVVMRALRHSVRGFAVGLAMLSGGALLAAAGAGDVRAQAPAPEPVAWELLGLEEAEITALAFAPGPAADGALDTLYASGFDGLFRLVSGAGWSGDVGPAGPPVHLTVTEGGHLLAGDEAGPLEVERSTDGGQAWEEALNEHVRCLYTATPTLGSAVLACERNEPYLRRSADGAAGTWTRLGPFHDDGPNEATWPLDLTELPPSQEAPSGRL
ncbi:MAG: hypothetical protein R3362_05930, partial [Rhodothermales bacterium]|nr:hypothetical protein [Rhodothermales bacterium]